MDEAEKPITLMIVDDQPLMRAGIAAAVKGRSDIALVGEAEHGAKAEGLCHSLQPNVLLVTLSEPIIRSMDSVASLASHCSQTRILMLTETAKQAQMLQKLTSGAVACLHQADLHNHLASTVRQLASGTQAPLRAVLSESSHRHTGPLSRRESEIVHWVAQGRSNREVAQLLTISEHTVNGHLRKAMIKLGARNRTQAVHIAMLRGLVFSSA